MKKAQKRRLKVYSKHQKRSLNTHVKVPEIKLCGKWLNEAGFEIDSKILIRLEDGKLIITNITEFHI